MDEKPTTRRRWFRLRLSTWFVLIAIVAWAMACRPHVGFECFYEMPHDRAYWQKMPLGKPYWKNWIVGHDFLRAGEQFNLIQFRIYPADDSALETQLRFKSLTRLLWPALALLAFLAWNACWRIRERQQAKDGRAAPTRERPTKCRRWLQFRPSTWFVLIAVVAWAMACRPHVGLEYSHEIPPTFEYWDSLAAGYDFLKTDDKYSIIELRIFPLNGSAQDVVLYFGSPIRLLAPALVLAAFLTWKAFWRIRERRRAK